MIEKEIHDTLQSTPDTEQLILEVAQSISLMGQYVSHYLCNATEAAYSALRPFLMWRMSRIKKVHEMYKRDQIRRGRYHG